MLKDIGLKSADEVDASDNIQTPPVIPLFVLYVPETGELRTGFKIDETLRVPLEECGNDEVHRMYVVSSLEASKDRVTNCLYGYVIDQIQKSIEGLQTGFVRGSGSDLDRSMDSLKALVSDLKKSVVLVEAVIKEGTNYVAGN